MRRHLRTIVFVAHVIVMVLMSLPGQNFVGTEQQWKQPYMQRRFARWANNISKIGVDVSGEGLEDFLRPLASGYRTFRNKIYSASKPLIWGLGFRQGWDMFSGVNKRAGRFYIEILDDARGQWRPIYITGSSKYDWHRTQLEHMRFRKTLVLIRIQPSQFRMNRIAKWFASQIAKEYPDALAIRVRLQQFVTPNPEDAKRGERAEPKFTHTAIVRLEEFR